jgi:hypothetical protein
MTLRITDEGQEVASGTFVSGDMTQEEYELGFPLNMLATHTEARALAQYPRYLRPGSDWQMNGHYLSCWACKGKLNKAAMTGATLSYQPGGFTAVAKPAKIKK